MSDLDSGAAVISLASFAIQRALQVVDPLVDFVVIETAKCWKKMGLTDGSDVKRAIMALAAVALGSLAVLTLDIQLLSAVGLSGHRVGDAVVSALVLSAGSEGANSVLKTFEAFKQSRKVSDDSVVVVLATPEITVKVSTVIQLRATIVNSASQDVQWACVEDKSMVIALDGTMTVPSIPGTYHVIAASTEHPAKTAVAKLTVVA